MARVRLPQAVINAYGHDVIKEVGPLTTVTVNTRNDGPATIYADETSATTLSNPTQADGFGWIEGWVDEGSYDLTVAAIGLPKFPSQRFEAVRGSSLGSGPASTGGTSSGASGQRPVANGSGGWSWGSTTAPPAGNIVTAIGDSLTGGSANSGANPPQLSANGFLGWVGALSNGRIAVANSHAIGGQTTAQMISGQLPLVLAMNPKPAACFVLGGTNDVAALVPTSTIIQNLQSICNTLMANSIVPILLTMPPRTGYEGPTSAMNDQLMRYAAKNGVHCVDYYIRVVDPATGQFLSAFSNGDGVHPNGAGAKVVGQAVVDQVMPLFPGWSPPLSGWNADTSLDLGNSCFLNSAAGLPTNWTNTLGSGATLAVAADAAILGNAWSITRGANDVAYQCTKVNGTPGDRYMAAIKVKITVAGVGGTADVRLFGSSTGGTMSRPISVWGTDMGWQTIYMEGVLPASDTGAKFQVMVQGASGAQIQVAQATLINMTARSFYPSP